MSESARSAPTRACRRGASTITSPRRPTSLLPSSARSSSGCERDIVAGFLEDPEVPPLERLEKLVEHHYAFAVANKDDTGHVWGCPIGNLAIEMSTQDEVLRERLSAFFSEMGRGIRSPSRRSRSPRRPPAARYGGCGPLPARLRAGCDPARKDGERPRSDQDDRADDRRNRDAPRQSPLAIGCSLTRN